MKCGRLTIDIDHEPIFERPAEYSSEVKTYTLSPEELAKYGPVSTKRCLLCGKEKSLLHFTTGISGKVGAICHECIRIKKEGKTMMCNNEARTIETKETANDTDVITNDVLRTKTCKKCGKTKPRDKFSSTYYVNTCDECLEEMSRQRSEMAAARHKEGKVNSTGSVAPKIKAEAKINPGAIKLKAPEGANAPKSGLKMTLYIDGEGDGENITNRMHNLSSVLVTMAKYRFTLSIEEVQD